MAENTPILNEIMSTLKEHDANLQAHRVRTEVILEKLQDDVRELMEIHALLEWWREFRGWSELFLHDFSGCYEEVRRIQAEGKSAQHMNIAKIAEALDKSLASFFALVSHANSFRTACVIELISGQGRPSGRRDEVDKDTAWLSQFVATLQENRQSIQRSLNESNPGKLLNDIGNLRTHIEAARARANKRIGSIAGEMGGIANRLRVACEMMIRGVEDEL